MIINDFINGIFTVQHFSDMSASIFRPKQCPKVTSDLHITYFLLKCETFLPVLE